MVRELIPRQHRWRWVRLKRSLAPVLHAVLWLLWALGLVALLSFDGFV